MLGALLAGGGPSHHVGEMPIDGADLISTFSEIIVGKNAYFDGFQSLSGGRISDQT